MSGFRRIALRARRFDPRTLGGLSAWYDASNAASITRTSGLVSQWSDLSGGGLHLTQASETSRPATTVVNGLTAVDFDGVNDHLFTTSAPAATGTVFCVHVLDAASTAYTLYHLQTGTGGTSTRMHLLYSSLNEYRSQGVAPGGVNIGASGGQRSPNARVAVNTFSGAAATGRVDGVTFSGTTIGTGSDQPGLWLGIRNIAGSLSLPLNGKICELISYNRVLSPAEIGIVERHLSAKWGAATYFYPDSDVNAYLQAVEVADGGVALEPGVRDAINAFITGCKADGIWPAIKASCILAGARTLAGALVPLAGAAPTNFNFVSGDYNRKTGLLGNGSTKYLDTGRAGNADPQDNMHMAVYLHSPHSLSAAGVYAGHGGTGNGATNLFRLASPGQHATRCRSTTSTNVAAGATGLFGVSRVASDAYTARTGGADYAVAVASQAATSDSVFVFSRNSGTGGTFGPTNARMSFYSIGENLSLSQLESRLATYLTAIGAAIP